MRAVADTSAIVASVLASSTDHQQCVAAIRDTSAAAAGHAWFESFSVLTRLPVDVRLTGEQAGKVLAGATASVRHLSKTEEAEFARWLSGGAVVGGAVYDALVGWVARCANLPLITRDVRALATYRALDIDVLLIGAD
jgi:predicted nucleic acid-binding protein